VSAGTRFPNLRALMWKEALIAEFADRLIADWDNVQPWERDVWLRRRLSDLVDSPRTEWRRWSR
jgi:hypothetical protein